MDEEETIRHFVDSYRNSDIQARRFGALDVLATRLASISQILEVAGWVMRDSNSAGMALLLKLSGQLTLGMKQLFAEQNLYASAALLRQLVEMEYILFLGYQDIDSIGTWYRSNSDSLRKQFTPQKMRNRSGGLFRDDEYWMHCELGGHPNPKAAILFREHDDLNLICFALPDAVHHARRLWTSVKLTLPKMRSEELKLEQLILDVNKAFAEWEAEEEPLILSYDGLAR